MTTRARKVILALFSLLVIGGLVFVAGRILLTDDGSDDDDGRPTPTASSASGVRLETASLSADAVGSGQARLRILLSKGQARADAVQTLPVAEGTPLSSAEVQQILDRVPALSATPGDVEEFRLPDELLPPPRPGQTITEPFPPPTVTVTPEAVAAGPLEVVRFSPEGEIPLAPFLNVTFNQPMVPLATIEELTAQEVPVRLTPSLPGVWKWLGTKTLTFEYQSDEIDRFPMATAYTVEVPAGTESATGGVLAEPVTWTFNTPPPQMETHYPSGGPQGLEPVFFVAFDQRIEPAAVLDTIGVTADGQEQGLRLATEEEVAADEFVSRRVENAPEGRWLAFRAQQTLPAAANVVVTIGPGTPSAEGPLLTEEAQSFSFNTYSPLDIVDHGCTWSDDCPPFSPLSIRFNNSLDQEAFAESMLRINPELPNATVSLAGNSITIQGATRGRTTYAVTVSGQVQDIFGQTLGREQTLRFRIGSAPPALMGPNQDLVTLDPSTGKPFFTVYTMNYDRLRLRAYAVAPADWPAYQEYARNFYPEEERPDPPGREVMNETVNVDAVDDVLTETNIDLSQALDGDTGHLVVVVEPPQALLSLNRNRERQTIRAWVQVTQIGLDAFVDHSQMVVWASDLQDGTPLSGVDLGLDGVTAVTGADGVARLDLPSQSAVLLVGRRDGDTAILPPSLNAWTQDAWRARPLTDELRWYVFDDRQMYRPGEEVHVKGWMRRVGSGQNGDVGLLDGAVTAVRYWVTGPQGNEFLAGEAEVNALGGFDMAFTLPQNSNLGYASLNLDAIGDGSLSRTGYSHNFQIQEFRRPEFEVSARAETPGPYFVGDEAVVAVSANYFAGGPLPNADVTWNVTSSPGSYAPPDWSGFTFGQWTPWWIEYGPVFEGEAMPYDYFGPESGGQSMVETFTGVTDAAGEHYLNLDFEAADKPQPFSVRAEATVMDVNRQAWAAATNLLVHPADLYVGLRSQRTFVERGTPLEIDVIVTDLDGNPVAGRPVEVQAARLEWGYRQGRWSEEPVETQTCTVESAEEPVTCTFTTDKGGTYQITATVSDDQGRLNQSQFRRWVSGGQRPPARNVEQEEVVLIPDKETYQPGDVAEILVQAPFSPAEGLLTVSRSGFLTTERFDMAEGSYTLQVPIEEAHLPNLHVQVDLVGSAPRTDEAGEPVPDVPPRPAYASGRLNLPISTRSRTLSLQVAPQEAALAPGGETAIDVAVTDANGQPVVDAEVAVVVVDEAILALTNYQSADPVDVFYQMRGSGISSYYGRATIVLANPELLGQQAVPRMQATMPAMAVTEGEAMMEAPMEEAAMADDAAAPPGAANAAAPIRVRTDFNPLATFAPAARTDGNGRAQVAVQLPDNLTRYRVMAVAVTGQQFGHGESNLTARLPLMVRPSAPRFLNFGDQFELPVVLQNQTDEDMTVDVAVQASNVALTGDAGQRVAVPANDRVEVRFPATTDRPGTARFQIAAVSGPYADAATVELPVYTPATTEAFATYGVIDEGAILQPVSAPDGVFPQFGGLEINTSSTALQALTDAVLYLVNYRYECSEQLASRILAVAALRDVLTAFEAEGLPTPAEMEAAVQRDIEELQGLQNNDGGFPVWRRGRESIPFYSIHVAHALQRARMKGFEVPEEMMQRSLTYLRDIENYYPSWYNQRMRYSLSAYALNVRQLMGDVDADKAARLFDEAGLEELTLEAVAWLWPVLDTDARYAAQVEAIGRHLNNRAVETAGAANFTTSYGDDAYLMLHSNRRTDGVVLDALITVQPDSDLIPKVVNGLLAHRTRGRWSNTQENVFILLALDHYFNTFETQTPDFVARVWLGDTYAGGHEFVGRTTERHQTEIPMRYLVETGADAETQDLILSKEGPGRLYYRLGLRYAPDDLDLDPLDMGFIVERTYEAVDDPGDVTRDEDGVWHIKAGARVRVRLKMVANNRRYHVALVDPLPAGLEIVNPALAVSQDSPPDTVEPSGGYSWWWWRNWYQHQNMRDERAEAFTTLLWEGVYDYAYVARATTPGTFVVPPTKAEEMYAPEVFGRSSSDLVIVE